MRIGVITSSYPTGQGDYAGHFVAAHVQWLRAHGHLVDVVKLPRIAVSGALRAGGFTRDAGIPDALEAMGELPLVARICSVSTWAGRAALALARQQGEALRRARHWDAVCAHWLAPSSLMGAMVVWQQGRMASGTRMPFLAIAHGGDVHVLRRLKLLHPTLALLCRAQASLVWVSPALRAQALAACPPALRDAVLARSMVSPMGIDAARFADVARRRQARHVKEAALPTRADERRLRLLVIARLVPVKGVDNVLMALGEVCRPCELVVVGDGPLRYALEQRARVLGSIAPQHRVRFCGAIDAGAVDEELVRADAVVIPSRTAVVDGAVRGEGMPVVALEALAAGVPLIHSGSGGLANLDWLGVELHNVRHCSLFSGHTAPQQVAKQLAQAIENIELTRMPNALTASKLTSEVCSVSDVQVADALGWERVASRLWSHWHG